MGDFDEGVASTELARWEDFHQVVSDPCFNSAEWLFRGQRNSTWLLESSLTRVLKKRQGDADSIVTEHLKQFQYAIRGRRGPNPPNLTDGSSLWPLGQHHGLTTPLLDWTTSPYVALFFAYAESEVDDTDYRLVFALNTSTLGFFSRKEPSEPAIEIVKPLSDENARLINQAAVFTVLPLKMDLETWVRRRFNAKCELVLTKIAVPNKDRCSSESS